MRAIWAIILAIQFFPFLVGPASAQAPARETELTTEKELWSYAIGMNVGNKLRYARPLIDLDVLMQGIADVLDGRELMTQERALQLRKDFNEVRLAAADSTRAVEGERNYAEGKEFLALNATREGVITTNTGLQYEVLVEGDGPRPLETDTVVIECSKMYLDGRVFESSFNFGHPYIMRVRAAIAGLHEALLLMREGSKYRLYIPHDLAYGPVGSGWVVGPYATLIYEVELLEIQ